MSTEVKNTQELVDSWLDAAKRHDAMPAVSCNIDTAKLSYQPKGADKVTIVAGNPTEVASAIVKAATEGRIADKALSNAKYFLTHKGGVPEVTFDAIAKRAASHNASVGAQNGATGVSRSARSSSTAKGDKTPKELAIARADVDSLQKKIDGILSEYAKIDMYRETLAALTATRDNLEAQHAAHIAAQKAEQEKAEQEKAQRAAEKLAKEAATVEAALKKAEQEEERARKSAEKAAALRKRAEELKAAKTAATAIPVADAAGQPVMGQTV